MKAIKSEISKKVENWNIYEQKDRNNETSKFEKISLVKSQILAVNIKVTSIV